VSNLRSRKSNLIRLARAFLLSAEAKVIDVPSDHGFKIVKDLESSPEGQAARCSNLNG